MVKHRHYFEILIFLSLGIVFFLVFILYPVMFSAGLSFFDWSGYSQNPFENFNGIDNFVRLVKDPTFILSLKNTFIFVFSVIIFQNLFGLLIAIFLFYGKLKGGSIWRSVIFFPAVLSPIIIGLVWKRIFFTDGLLNTIIGVFVPGYEPYQWLSNLVTPIFVVVFVTIWQFTGYNMVLYYAGLQGINSDLIEAAKIDGANWVQTVTKIVIPQLYKVISLAVILNIIGGFKVFDMIYIMTSGGPAHSSEVLTSYIYFQSFSITGTNRMGYASLLAMVLTIVVLIFSVIRLRIEKRID